MAPTSWPAWPAQVVSAELTADTLKKFYSTQVPLAHLFQQFNTTKLVIRAPEMYIPTVWFSWLWHQVAELVEHNVEFELLWLATAPPYPDGAQG